MEVKKDAFQEMPGNQQLLPAQCPAERGHSSEVRALGLPTPFPRALEVCSTLKVLLKGLREPLCRQSEGWGQGAAIL